MGENMLNHGIKNGKFLSIFLIMFFLISIPLSTNIMAHSPSSMKISYNLEAKTINATISHSVSNPNNHYVNEIEVRINEQLYETFEYTSQPGSSFTYALDSIEADVGDIIEVKAICNQGGQITRQLTIGEGNGESSDDESTPGFEMLLFIFSMLMVYIFIRKKSTTKKK
jgi:hypothetical protein